MVMAEDIGNMVADETDEATATPSDDRIAPTVTNLVKTIQKRISDDKKHSAKAFDRMRRDMHVARIGATPDWPEDFYTANIAGRHVKMKTASLYAKNPKAIAKRRETLDFKVWDESPQSLQTAMQTIMMAQQLMQGLQVDPETGQPRLDRADVQTQQAIQAFETAQATVEDYQQGMTRREQLQKIGKTLEILFAQAMREQKPVDFKTGMKQLVRRASTTGVGYIEIGFQREYGPRPGMMEKLADFRARLDHLRVLSENIADTEDPIDPDDPEIAELEYSIQSMQQEAEIIVREGLIIDFPQSTKVIPDKLCRALVGFIGARHLTIEYMYTPDQVREVFGVDLDGKYKGYKEDGKLSSESSGANYVEDDEESHWVETESGTGICCVWKHYDKASGLTYYLCDGYDQFLREPAAPDVFVEDFWPVYALTFNEVEDEKNLFPPSDVSLICDQQMEYNRARQGAREHRDAARPRWAYQNGMIEDDDLERLQKAKPFDAISMNLPQGGSLQDVLMAIQVPGVDPNLYQTSEIFSDIQLTVGASEAHFGGVAKATATESAIAAGSVASADSASVDDLDGFLTRVARASGQVLLREMSEEQVMKIAGVGAVWPEMSLEDIANEVFLEVEAGSTGKPNQAVEINNWKYMLPFLMQMPGINPAWLARETLRRLDDNADLTEALAENIPSIMAQNRIAQMSTGDPQSDPNAQEAEGSDNQERPQEGQQGSDPAFGSNQTG